MPPCFHSSIQNSPLPPALQDIPFSDILTPYASVAQLVEQVTLNHLVLGSSPSRGNPLILQHPQMHEMWHLSPQIRFR